MKYLTTDNCVMPVMAFVALHLTWKEININLDVSVYFRENQVIAVCCENDIENLAFIE
jgi:hypothetical protein